MSIAPALIPPSPHPLRHAAEKHILVPVSLAPILLTPVVLLVHGYHPFAGDAGIYVAGVRHILNPSLYPLNSAFPATFTRLSILPWMLAALVRIAHLPLSWVLLSAHLLSIFLFLTACRKLATDLFPGDAARWFSQILAAACFTLPVAGTALFVMDPYVTARSFSTPVSLMALAASIERAWPRAILLLIIATLIHPLMGAYAVVFVILHALTASGHRLLGLTICGAFVTIAGTAFVLAHRTPFSPAYREAVSLPPRTFLFLARWHWYEILGLLLPLILFALALRKLRPASRKASLCLTCLLVGITSILIAALFVPSDGPYALVPLQILRNFHLIYMVGIVLSGGILAELMARSRPVAVAIFALLFTGMFAAQRFTWSGSNRVEWPGSHPSNPYQQAFLWIRDNTPRDAVFAFNPQLVYLPHEDEQGFRAIAQRDHLADDKDAGIVAVRPQLAGRWALQRNADLNVNRMTDPERVAVLPSLGATWLLLPPKADTAFPCPWSNEVVKICQMAP
jgi:hypothetical protein